MDPLGWLDEHIVKRGDVRYARERRSLLRTIFIGLRNGEYLGEGELDKQKYRVLDVLLAFEGLRLRHLVGATCSLVIVEETEFDHVVRRVWGEIGVRLQRDTACSNETPLGEVLASYGDYSATADLKFPSRRLALAVLSPSPIGPAAQALFEDAAATYQHYLEVFELLLRLSREMNKPARGWRPMLGDGRHGNLAESLLSGALRPTEYARTVMPFPEIGRERRTAFSERWGMLLLAVSGLALLTVGVLCFAAARATHVAVPVQVAVYFWGGVTFFALLSPLHRVGLQQLRLETRHIEHRHCSRTMRCGCVATKDTWTTCGIRYTAATQI